ncbi:MAG: hypothetical protein P8J29_00640 [Rhodospirillales bacterium]|nr:hypothetical protein [Rhodospirillales bacterium]
MSYISILSPVGDITLFEDAGTIIALDEGWAGSQQVAPTLVLTETTRQLNAYFTGAFIAFDPPLARPSSSFKKNLIENPENSLW